jgi:hypothetical protein
LKSWEEETKGVEVEVEAELAAAMIEEHNVKWDSTY